ncbi:type VI secretion system baseplate subunit TssE [Burkholderia stagnalis]|uniref:type VI secretion system baseplate subunit TssE n=1 Tax=Burkholderia stagnalis TaxID=1503054 RepID=UPI000F561476|nr:type VI secretion system baseplate subunit TssE [Burkholderia stagnalis]RQP94353.1 type VI secretion system baseplate subunit TssE [Burkholderia stagnalis]RQQ05149.1 type VI secretion system baseplate subunit TssE [Burkholderia stagnalis]RQQ21991.1 type VI secretion system baseplate subunit TssE [Burkholderia stagnalis]RQQ23371.1 type VI secretion system baseplate subunit TssE [Burkholderia stagnalis]RQQ24341.1 type VI secretion system baseplate subunit TssE [Burkholderia stagnalis]
MTRGPGLFEAITGHFANGSQIDDFDAATQTFLSVQDNIQRILNSRRNGLAHLPDYGLDDLSEIYRHLPSSAHKLRHAIEATILKYEPRVKAIDIQVSETEPGMLLSFTMSCHLHQEGLVRFGTHFTPDGRTRLRILKANLDRD